MTRCVELISLPFSCHFSLSFASSAASLHDFTPDVVSRFNIWCEIMERICKSLDFDSIRFDTVNSIEISMYRPNLSFTFTLITAKNQEACLMFSPMSNSPQVPIIGLAWFSCKLKSSRKSQVTANEVSFTPNFCCRHLQYIGLHDTVILKLAVYHHLILIFTA